MRKKELLLLAGVVLITAGCSNDETVEVPKGQEIAFSGAFVNKVGRGAETGNIVQTPDLTKENFAVCKVWGSSSIANNYIFDGTELTVGQDGAASYSPPRYWDKNSVYHFMAIGSSKKTSSDSPSWTYTSPESIPTADGLYGSLLFDNSIANGVEDIAYAGVDRTTDDNLTNVSPVALNFKHALSRIRFKFVNAMDEGYYLEITDVQVSELPTSGTLQFGNPESDDAAMKWVTEGEYEKALGIYKDDGEDADFAASAARSTVTMFTLPTTNPFKVNFGVNLYLSQGDEKVLVNGDTPYSHEATIKVTQQGEQGGEIPGLLMGKAYVFTATINKENIQPGGLHPIEFTVDVTSYDEDTDVPMTLAE